MTLRRILLHILTLTALSAATLLALAVSGPRQVLQRRAQEPLGVLVHLVGDPAGGGRARAAGRLRHRVQARARHHARAPGALHRPRLRPLRHPTSRRSRSRTSPRATATTRSSSWRCTTATWRRTRPGTSARRSRWRHRPPRRSMVRWLKERYSSSRLVAAQRARAQPAGSPTRAGRPAPRPTCPRSSPRGSSSSATTTRRPATGTRSLPKEPIDRAEVAYMFYRGYKVASDWQLYGLADYKDITFPAAQRPPEAGRQVRAQVRRLPVHLGRRVPDAGLALRHAEGRRLRLLGLRLLRDEDALRLHSITVNERGAHDMAAVAKPRITRGKLQVRRPDLLRAEGAELERRVDLPRRPVPRAAAGSSTRRARATASRWPR